MAVHDWTRVDPGIWHDFHQRWTTRIGETLNGGLLPEGYYALVERATSEPEDGRRVPDVLTLSTDADAGGATTLVRQPPQTRVRVQAPFRAGADTPFRRRNRVTVRRDDDRVVCIELVSPGNKTGREAFEAMLAKAERLLAAGVHLLLIDLFPPTPRDPQGLHGALWTRLTDQAAFPPPPDAPLTLAAYRSLGDGCEAYVEPTAVGAVLADMPVFLDGGHVPLPLAPAYDATFAGVPAKYRRRLE